MQRIVIWKADDGSMFPTKSACMAYEHNDLWELVSQEVPMFDKGGSRVMVYSKEEFETKVAFIYIPGKRAAQILDSAREEEIARFSSADTYPLLYASDFTGWCDISYIIPAMYRLGTWLHDNKNLREE